MKKLLLSILIIASSSGLLAAGFTGTGQGARQMGKGGTGLSDGDSAMSMYYNPALLNQGKGLRFYSNLTLLYNITDLDSQDINFQRENIWFDKDGKALEKPAEAGDGEMEKFTLPGGLNKNIRTPFMQPAFFLSYGDNDGVWGIGLAAYGPLAGANHKWHRPGKEPLNPDSNYAENNGDNFRFGFHHSEVIEQTNSLAFSIDLNHFLGFSFFKKLNFGASLDYSLIMTDQEFQVPFKKSFQDLKKQENYPSRNERGLILPSTINAELEQIGLISYSLGAFLQATDDLSFSAYYHPEKPYDLSGKFKTKLRKGIGLFNVLGSNYLIPSQETLLTKDVNLDITLPAIIGGGTKIEVDRLTVELDMEMVFWSSIKEFRIYNKNPYAEMEGQNLNKPDAKPIDIRLNVLPEEIVYPKNFQDSVALKLGANYKVEENLELRAGGYFETSGIPEETVDQSLVDSEKFAFSVGTGYKIGAFTIDFAYMVIFLNTINKEKSILNSLKLKQPGSDPENITEKDLSAEVDLFPKENESWTDKKENGKPLIQLPVKETLNFEFNEIGKGKYSSTRHYFSIGIETNLSELF